MSVKNSVRDLIAIGLAGGGALLLFLSFLLDWARIDLDTDGVTFGVDQLPTWGTAYVIGVMLLVALFVGVMTLPVAIGRAARVLGVGWAVGVAAILSAVVVRAGDNSIGWLSTIPPVGLGAEDFTVRWKAGFFCAVTALVLMIAAFVLARAPLGEPGRQPPAEPPPGGLIGEDQRDGR